MLRCTGFRCSGFSKDSRGAAGGEVARPKPQVATAASKDTGCGPDSTSVAAGSSHKAPPTPEEEAIISQAIDMLCCDRQDVVRPSGRMWPATTNSFNHVDIGTVLDARYVCQLTVIENLKIADKIIGPEIVIDTLLSSH